MKRNYTIDELLIFARSIGKGLDFESAKKEVCDTVWGRAYSNALLEGDTFRQANAKAKESVVGLS